MMQGELGAVNRLRHQPNVVKAYRGLEDVFDDLHRFQVVSYTQPIDQIYQSMTTQQKRVGTQDCRIAATAVALGYTVVTANTTDFYNIGGVAVEDWTIQS
jgi:tRNA(fMet)-specific endonuclease VapC